MSENLRIGIPSKGRLAEMASELLIEAGLKFRRQERSLFARVRDMPIEITFLRTDDIPVLCAEGAIDMGITGGDLIDETGVELTTRLRAGHGQLAAGDLRARGQQASEAGRPRRLPHRHELSQRHAEVSRPAQSHRPHRRAHRLGRSDDRARRGRRDCRPGGNRQHAGRQSATVSTSSAATKPCSCRTRRRKHAQLADRVVRRLEGVVIARSYSLLEYNVPEAKLAEAEKITPGFESPTVNKLEEAGWFAVRAMVKRSEVIEIMERLEALGATAILETAITNCRL